MIAIVLIFFPDRSEVLFVLTDEPSTALAQAAWHGSSSAKILGWR